MPAVLRLSQPALRVAYSGTFTLTVLGGLVRGFQITGPALASDLLISPLAGSLASGQRVMVTVTVQSAAGLTFVTYLTIDPGRLTVTVLYPPCG